jgi:hypothetical protein
VQDVGTVDELLARQPAFREMLRQPGSGSPGTLVPEVDLNAPAANEVPVSTVPILAAKAALL